MMNLNPAINQNDYIENAYYYRGKMIDKFCSLELEIERYLVRYFLDIPAERRVLKNLIIDRLTFESKRAALRTMLEEKSIAKGFIKTKSNSYPHSELLKEIDYLNKKRVYFAHYYLALPFDENCKNFVICLTEYRDSIKVFNYNSTEFDELIRRIELAANEVSKLSKI